MKFDLGMDAKKLANREFSRSLFIVEDIKSGDVLTEKNIRSIRPGNGLHPKHWNEIKGKVFNQSFEKGTPLRIDMFN